MADNLERSVIENMNDPLASAWMRKIFKANKYYEDWSNKFKCNELEEYYYGFQWKDGSTAVKYDRYTINLIFSTIEVKKPTLLFQNVLFRVKPRPAAGEFDFKSSAERASVREDLLNTVVSNDEMDFDEEFETFVVDAFFRFGVMEIGYSANWIENPAADKPVLRSDNNPYVDPETDEEIKQPKELPEDERVYFKRIPPWRFRVGGVDGFQFKNCSWVGYYDYFRIQDLKANKALNQKALDEINWAGMRSEDFPSEMNEERHTPEQDEMLKGGDMIKIWTIYDIRAKKKYIFAESQCITLLEKKWPKVGKKSYLPLVSLKYVNKLRGWYPLPLVYNWKSPQDEINEAREQQRIHRRRAKRTYLYPDGFFADDGEIDKIENGPDMTFAKYQGGDPTKFYPVPNAPLDQVTQDSMIISKDDLNIISGTSSEQRGQADRTTATQANLIDMRSQLRETRARIQVANALRDIGRITLLVIQENFSLEFWVKCRTNRNDEDFLGEFKEAQFEWKQFKANDLGEDDDFQVDISIDSISPIENGQAKSAFLEFLTILTQFPQIAFDPVLVREAAYRCNYRNEKVIARMAQMAQIAAIGQVEAAKNGVMQQALQSGMLIGGQGQPGGNPAQTRQAQMAAPGMTDLQTQLQNQPGVGMGVPVQ